MGVITGKEIFHSQEAGCCCLLCKSSAEYDTQEIKPGVAMGSLLSVCMDLKLNNIHHYHLCCKCINARVPLKTDKKQTTTTTKRP